MKTISRTVMIAVALTLGGCNAYTLAPAGQPLVVASTFNATPTINWSRMQKDQTEVWTVDGHLLDKLTFLSGIKDGASLSPNNLGVFNQGPLTAEGNPPTFRKDMVSIEIAELVKETYTRKGYQNFKIANLQPDRLANNDGFRFDFSFLTKDGLDKQGLAVGTGIDNNLYLAIYTGAKEHYFAKYKDVVEETLRELTFTKTKS